MNRVAYVCPPPPDLNSNEELGRLDSIGKGCFSYDFDSLTGSIPPVMKALDSFHSLRRTFFYILWSIINPFFPRLAMKIHREYSDALEFFAESLREIARNLLAREQGGASGIEDKSGMASSHVQMSFKEMQSRVCSLFTSW